MSALELARLQFGVTTVYHFLFVPVSDRPGLLVAILQTAAPADRGTGVRAHDAVLGQADAHQLRGRRGDRHRPGVPVRDELERVLALRRRRLRRAAGDRGAGRVLPGVDVPRALDLRPRPAFAASSTSPRSGWWPSARRLSAYFILAANSWMQHPVGYSSSTATGGRAEMTSICAVLTNSTLLYAFAHTMPARADHRGGPDARRSRPGTLMRRREDDQFARSARIALALVPRGHHRRHAHASSATSRRSS